MAEDNTKAIAELKKIAAMKFDLERHRLAAVKDELQRLQQERKALARRISDVASANEASPLALMNAQAYLDALSNKAKHLDSAQSEAHKRTDAQRERIKQALASKIRVDDMDTK